jgi:hypothetical protein
MNVMAQDLSSGEMKIPMMWKCASVVGSITNGRDNRTNFVSASVYNVGHRNTKELKEKEINKMDTYNRILKAQQEQREIQALKDKRVVEAMFANHMRPLNNSHLLKKADN